MGQPISALPPAPRRRYVFWTSHARLADQAALEASHLKARREQALMAWSDAQQAFGAVLQAARRCEWLLARSERLFSRSRVAIRRMTTPDRPPQVTIAMTPEERQQHATRCRELAELALADRQRQCFLSIAHLYEREIELLERAAINIAQSRGLLAKVEDKSTHGTFAMFASSPSAHSGT
jgi:hypothetical protein